MWSATRRVLRTQPASRRDGLACGRIRLQFDRHMLFMPIYPLATIGSRAPPHCPSRWLCTAPLQSSAPTFVADHALMRWVPNGTRLPDADLHASPHPAQSLSVDTTMRDGVTCCRWTALASGVPVRYRTILLTFVKSPSVGFHLPGCFHHRGRAVGTICHQIGKPHAWSPSGKLLRLPPPVSRPRCPHT